MPEICSVAERSWRILEISYRKTDPFGFGKRVPQGTGKFILLGEFHKALNKR